MGAFAPDTSGYDVPAMTSHQLAAGLTVDQNTLADLCRRHGISAIRVFGSAIGPSFEPGSGMDILVQIRMLLLCRRLTGSSAMLQECLGTHQATGNGRG